MTSVLKMLPSALGSIFKTEVSFSPYGPPSRQITYMYFDNTVLCFDNIVLCYDNTVLRFNNIVLCYDNTVLCFDNSLSVFR